MTGVRPSELDLPVDPPTGFQWIWYVFHELNSGRHFQERGNPQRISNQEILAWCTLTGETLTKRELSIIRMMDTCWINTRIELSRDLS